MKKRSKSTFKKGYTRSRESIEKQRATMKKQYREGLREPPNVVWTPERVSRRTKACIKTKLKTYPIGTRRLHSSGSIAYWVVKVSGSGKWPYEHRIIMEKKLRRSLKKGEHVHHIDGNSLNNSPKNLEILTHSKHSFKHGKLRKPNPKFKKSVPPGKWTMHHGSCIECGTTTIKHASKGRCNNCYGRWYRRHRQRN